MTNQEMILHIADSMDALVKSIRHFAENMCLPAPVEKCEEATPPVSVKAVTLEEVRGMLASKSAAGKNAEVKALIKKYGADKLSAIDPAVYADLLHDAEVL